MLIYSELDQQVMSEKIRKGLAKAKLEGRSLGRPPLHKFSSEEIESVREERKAGATIESLAIKYGSSLWKIHSLVRDLKASDVIVIEPETETETEELSQKSLQISIWASGDLLLEAHCLALEKVLEFTSKQNKKATGFVAFGLSEELWKIQKSLHIQTCQVCKKEFRFVGCSQLVVVQKRHGGEPTKVFFPCCSLDCREMIHNLARRLKQEERTLWLQMERAKKLLQKARQLSKNRCALSSEESGKSEQGPILPNA